MARSPLPAALPDPDWWEIPWQDWVGVGGTALGVVGFALAVVGLAYTYGQARDAKLAANRAETAAEAASNAIELTQAQLRGNMQLILLPGLQRVSQELDDAIQRKAHLEARSALDRWRFQAGHIRGLLQREVPEPRGVLNLLKESVIHSGIAAEELLAEEKSVFDSCKEARRTIANACDGVTHLAGKTVTQVRTEVPSTEAKADD